MYLPAKISLICRIEKNKWQVLLLLIIVTFLSYSNLINADFVDYDDPGNVLQNHYITGLTLQNIKDLFTNAIHYSYNPVTFLSYSLEYSLSGINSSVFHFDNIILHLINIILVFIFVRSISNHISLSMISAVLFALHPIQADVVGWVSARNYLLCTLFYLSSLIFFFHHLHSQNRKYVLLFVSLIFFILACLSKAQAVTLPVMLFLIDRILKISYNRAAIIVRLVYILIAICTGLLTIYFREDMGKTEVIADFTFSDEFSFFDSR